MAVHINPSATLNKTNKCVYTRLAILFLFITVYAIPSTAYAQDQTPPWKYNLQCDEKVQNYKGVEYCTQEFLGSTFYVIVIDLSSTAVGVEYVIVEGEDRNGNFGECRDVNIPRWSKWVGCKDPIDASLYPVMPFDYAVKRAKKIGAIALINADYSACTVLSKDCPLGKYRSHGPEGLTIVKKDRLDGRLVGDTDDNAVMRPWLAVSESNPESPLKAELNQLEHDDGTKPYNWIYTGVGGGPWLIKDVSVQSDDINKCKGLVDLHSCASYVAQTAVGVSQDKNYLYLVAAKGQNAKGIAEFMQQQLHLWQAIKLDGGGSTQLWYAGLEKPFVLTGDGRPLTNYLAVIAEPGSGIILPPEPGPEPVPEPEPEPSPRFSWLDQLLEIWHRIGQSIKQTWESIVQSLEKIRQTIEDLQQWVRNIQDPEWWAEQALNWTLRCCGSALVPTGLVGGWLWLRRRQKIQK